MAVKNTIIVEVKGGVVQAVYASPDLQEQKIDVTILDYDNIEGNGGKLEPSQKVAEEQIERGKVKDIL